MGQTLTHGVYLPDEGERNCYNGLAANWQLLDNSVGTIAEHTTALAGKAPAVHTHTKADITDLLNSNFIPSANNSYDLGSSSYQWNNVYSKNYYYNGVAWGLDKANVYSLEQTISATSGKSWNVKNTNYTLGENTPSSNKLIGAFAVQDNDNNNAFLFNLNHYSNGEVLSRWLTRFKFTNDVKSTTGTQKAAVIEMGLTNSGDRFARPGTNGDMDLGTSSYKWKTLNGVNPGALSLPDYNNCLDVTSEVPVASLDGNTLINLDDYLSNKTGWLSIVIDDTAGNSILVTQGKTGGATAFNNSRSFHTGAQSGGYISVFIPLISGMSKKAFIKASSLIQMRFYYCLGNV